jgi:hypothetical protein
MVCSFHGEKLESKVFIKQSVELALAALKIAVAARNKRV